MTDEEQLFLHVLEGKVYRWSAPKLSVEEASWTMWVSRADIVKALKEHRSIYGQVWFNGGWSWLDRTEVIEAGLWKHEWEY